MFKKDIKHQEAIVSIIKVLCFISPPWTIFSEDVILRGCHSAVSVFFYQLYMSKEGDTGVLSTMPFPHSYGDSFCYYLHVTFCREVRCAVPPRSSLVLHKMQAKASNMHQTND